MKEHQHKRVIISGGGTGGHVFPAIAIANALRRHDPGMEILFVGALGKIEMKKVPAAGYKIEGLPVEGLLRKVSTRNIRVLVNLFRSLRRARKIIRDFKPDVVVGVGGYASGPLLKMAGRTGVPTLLQEQNSFAGLTNRLLARKARKICVAYEGMEKYFDKSKIIYTGNPVRRDIYEAEISRSDAVEYFGLDRAKSVILVMGGSGGAGNINEAVLSGLNEFHERGCAVIWQTGKYYFRNIVERVGANVKESRIVDFIDRMDMAYAAADIIVSRAGAGTISELCLAGKPVVLIPSPNVAEDHQTRNAEALVRKEAAILLADWDAGEKLTGVVIELLNDKEKRKQLSFNISKMAINNADERIANEVLSLV